MVFSDSYSRANEQSGHARLGDPRRTRCLVSLASSLAQHAGFSIVKSSQPTAQVEGAYRLIRNPSVSPHAISEAGFTATARACEAHRCTSRWKTPPLTSVTVRHLMAWGISPLTRRRVGCWLTLS